MHGDPGDAARRPGRPRATDICVNSILGERGSPKSIENPCALRDRFRSRGGTSGYAVHGTDNNNDDAEACILGFRKFSRVVQFEPAWYSLRMVVQFDGGSF